MQVRAAGPAGVARVRNVFPRLNAVTRTHTNAVPVEVRIDSKRAVFMQNTHEIGEVGIFAEIGPTFEIKIDGLSSYAGGAFSPMKIDPQKGYI